MRLVFLNHYHSNMANIQVKSGKNAFGTWNQELGPFADLFLVFHCIFHKSEFSGQNCEKEICELYMFAVGNSAINSVIV